LRNSCTQSLFSKVFFGCALLAALVAGVAALPQQMAAQESTSAATSPATTAAPAGDTAKPEAAKSEEENNDVYRHTPLVEAAGKLLHLDVETTARLFELINFGIIVLANRSEKLQEKIESARKATGDANVRLSAIEAKLEGLDDEIAKIRAQVEQESVADQARVQAGLKEESERIVASAEQEIAQAAAAARRGLRYFAADLAIDQAAKQLVLTAEADKALIAEFAAELGATGNAKGGRN